MELETKYFGIVDVEPDAIFTFPYGLPGFPDEKEFLLLPSGEDSPFIIMQSTTTPETAFITVEPWGWFSDYSMDTILKAKTYVPTDTTEHLLVLVIARIPEDVQQATVNLLAPILINKQKKIAEQLQLSVSKYSIRHPLFQAPNEEGIG